MYQRLHRQRGIRPVHLLYNGTLHCDLCTERYNGQERLSDRKIKMGIGGECRKFAANVFNKNKCSNCYKLRDQHCDEALETGKLARNISRCGFLFVAPDWDFTNPVYRYV